MSGKGSFCVHPLTLTVLTVMIKWFDCIKMRRQGLYKQAMVKNPTLKSNLETIQQTARERTVKTQNVEYDLETLVKRIKSHSIKLDPDYQRRHRWTIETSSRLIESLVLNIPIPAIFISQDIDVDDEVDSNISRYTVIDGQQRLTAIYDYLNGSFALDGLETLSELNGSFYRDLPPFLIRRLEERTVKCLRIDSTVDSQVKFDIFERLNTGSVKLEAQELRNATARGPFNDLIKELALYQPFRALIQVNDAEPEASVKVQRMEDAELVLRFFALKAGRYKQLRKGFKAFLTASMVEFNQFDGDQLKLMSREFKTYMRFIHDNAGPKAFSKWRIDGERRKQMSSFNAAVYDAVAIGIASTFSVNEIRRDAGVQTMTIRDYDVLFEDRDFFAAVSGSVNDAAKVNYRIDAMIEFLQ